MADHSRRRSGAGLANLLARLKHKVFGAEHEFLLVVWQLDHAPIHSVNGFGDLPVTLLRPFALTGTFGYEMVDEKLKITGFDPDSNPRFTSGSSST